MIDWEEEKKKDKKRKKQREQYQRQRNKQVDKKLEEQYHESAVPRYICSIDGTVFRRLNDLTDYFRTRYDFDAETIIPRNPFDMNYIVLNTLIDVFSSKEYRKRKYFKVSCRFLWKELVRKLGFSEDDKAAPSNQTPYWILNNLGLLDKHKHIKRRKTFDKHSRSVYQLSVPEVKDVIIQSNFTDLKVKIGKVDDAYLSIHPVLKPLKPLSSAKNKKLIKGSKGFEGQSDFST
jgi:hypothetical protein